MQFGYRSTKRFDPVSWPSGGGQRGISLLEVLIALLVALLLAMLIVPQVYRARIAANERATVNTLGNIYGAEVNLFVQTDPHVYTADLRMLVQAFGSPGLGYILELEGGGSLSGYWIQLQVGQPNPKGEIGSFSVSAWPERYRRTGVRTFYIDQTGFLRAGDAQGQPGGTKLPILMRE